MKMQRIISRAVGVLALLAVAGCATIMTGSNQSVKISSDPEGATVKIYDSAGMVVFNSKTPAVAVLKKGTGYFEAASYRVVIERTGYSSQEIMLKASMNVGWYLVGNIFLGGLIGWLVIDPITGGMWTLSPSEIGVEMKRGNALAPKNDALIVVLREQVPDRVADVLRPIPVAN